jgi:hypothetical protein
MISRRNRRPSLVKPRKEHRSRTSRSGWSGSTKIDNTPYMTISRLPLLYPSRPPLLVEVDLRLERLEHCRAIAGVVACYPANLDTGEHAEYTNIQRHTLCVIRYLLAMLYRARPKRAPLWAVFIWVNPNRAERRRQSVGVTSSTQCPVTARYASRLLACHASHVILISPFTVSPYHNEEK